MMSEKRFKSPIENALRGCQFGVKLGKNSKFRRNRFKIAPVRARTDTQTDTHRDTHTEITQVIL